MLRHSRIAFAALICVLAALVACQPELPAKPASSAIEQTKCALLKAFGQDPILYGLPLCASPPPPSPPPAGPPPSIAPAPVPTAPVPAPNAPTPAPIPSIVPAPQPAPFVPMPAPAQPPIVYGTCDSCPNDGGNQDNVCSVNSVNGDVCTSPPCISFCFSDYTGTCMRVALFMSSYTSCTTTADCRAGQACIVWNGLKCLDLAPLPECPLPPLSPPPP